MGRCGGSVCKCSQYLWSVISKGMQAEPGLGCSCTASPPAVRREDPIAAFCFRTTADNSFQLNNLRGFSAVLQLFISRINSDPSQCFQRTLPLCPCCHHGDHVLMHIPSLCSRRQKSEAVVPALLTQREMGQRVCKSTFMT